MPQVRNRSMVLQTVRSSGTLYIRPLICLLLGLGALIVVSLIGHQQIQRSASILQSRGQSGGDRPSERWPAQYINDVERTSSQLLIKNILGENIKKNLRRLTRKPHTAGTDSNYKIAQWIKDQWKSQGLEDVHFAEYNVLLSHPSDPDRPNTIELLGNRGELIFRSIGQQPALIPEEQSDPGANFTYNAYSASGTATGQLIYANYGRREDYEFLDKKNISLKGKIVMARYGLIWRGAKILGAQRRGAAGVILYSDPADACARNTTPIEANTYPYTVYMPKGGVQLGSLLNIDGDPLTPLYPAIESTFRSKAIPDLLHDQIIPSIPVQPISYADAYQFLSRMRGDKAPLGWQGGLNVTYRLDQGGDSNFRIRLTVRANTTMGKIRNVIGFIEGRQEPDKYVIVGNHFDAWIYGAIDPNSGTAVMLEMSRAFMRLVNETAWRPLRTIVFCAWDGEEYGLLGSTEWVEQYLTLLDRRAVAYLNVDCITGNETFSAQASPTLYRSAVTAAKRVPNPDPRESAVGRRTVFDTWIRRMPPDVISGIPKMSEPAGGSDHVPFFKYLGLPVLDFTYENLTKDQSYPLYHTLYETPFVEEKLQDPNNFAFHVATGQFWAELTRLLADTNLLPLNVDDYAVMLKKYTQDLNETLSIVEILPKIKEIDQDFGYLLKAIDQLLDRAAKFHHYAADIRRAINPSPYTLEIFNSRLAQIERCFVNPRGGNPADPYSRHVIYGTGTEDSYASNRLPFVYDQIGKYAKATTKEQRDAAVKNLRQQLSIVTYSVNCAISLLKKTPVRAR